MKGIIFTEFLEMVGQKMGPTMVETIIEDAKLTNGGAYTSVGTYPVSEIESLIQELEKQTKLNREQLLEAFGRHLFGSLAKNYPHFFPDSIQFLDFLSGIHDYIHVEVRKLYPDAELPDLIVQEKSDNHIVLLYESSRKMSSLATGLMYGSMDYFKVNAKVGKKDLKSDGSKVLFVIMLNE